MPKAKRGQGRNARGSEEYARVDHRGLGDGQPVGDQADQERQCGKGQQDAGDAAADRQQQALGEQLADQALAPGAHGGAHGEFLAAREGARQQQVGQVGAADQEHAEGGAEQGGEQHARTPGEFVAQGVDAGAEVFVRLGPGALHGGGDDIHFGLGGLQGHAATELGKDADVVVGAVGEIVFAEARGDPDLRAAGREGEIARHDADHGVGQGIENHGAAGDAGSAPKRERHSASLSRTVLGAPGRSSSGVKARPSAG